MPRPSRYYTTEEVAALFAVRRKPIRACIAAGELRAVKIHRQWRVADSEIERVVREFADAG